MAAVNYESRSYILCMARYLESGTENMRRREVELARSTTWALATSEAVTWDLHGYPYSSPAQEACECDESSGDELFGSDCR